MAPSRKKGWCAMRKRLIIGVVVLILTAATPGQVVLPIYPPATPQTEELILTEIRALRADLVETARVSTQAQLLVARLQLQAQRITALAGQLSDVRTRLQQAQSARLRAEEQQLRAEELKLSALLSAEQARWNAFNDRLDEIEGRLPVR